MARKEEITGLLNRLGESAREAPVPDYAESLEARQDADPTPHKIRGSWPGEHYVLVGNSYNAEYRIVGTELEARRAGSIALMLEQRGGRCRCVALREALAFAGFYEVLSRFERDWLERISPDTLIGPAYDRYGTPVRIAFAVWRPVSQRVESEPHLVTASH